MELEYDKSTVPFRRNTTEVRGFGLRDLVLVGALMVLALFLRLYGVVEPQEFIFDEIYYVPAAEALWHGLEDPNSVHPPLGKHMIALGMEAAKLGGTGGPWTSLGWRLCSILCGVLMVGATYGLCWTLYPGHRVACTAASFVVATEHLHLSMSRIAMLEAPLALLCLLGTWAVLVYVKGGREGWAAVGALLLGLATGIKWSGLLTAFGCLLACLWYRRRDEDRERPLRLLLWMVLLIPAGFLLSYLHLFRLDGWSLETLKTIYHQAEQMVLFRYDEARFTHTYTSSFWQWPLMLRPIWILYEKATGSGSPQVIGICAMGMPLLWWGFVLLAFQRAAASLRGRDDISGLLLALWVGQWLPWAASTTGGFFYYMLPQVPLMAILVGKLWADLADFDDALGEKRGWAWLVLALYLVGALAYLPYALGLPNSEAVFRALFFLPSWI